jgi:N-hydroxyarylamine O-acetyltransferase
VGFGGDGILGPVPLDGREQERYGSTHRIVAEGLRQVLQVREGDVWSDLYALEPSEVFPIDLVIANHYTSTHPDSKFTQLLTAQWCAPGRRTFLRDLSLKVEGEPDRELEPGDLMGVLADRFGLRFPPGTRFNPPGAAPAAGRCP